MKEELKGTITISKPQGVGCDYINIELSDSKSRVRFCEIKIKYADFAQAITGLARQPCDIVVRGLQNVGKTYEHKTLEFPLPEGSTYRDKGAAELEALKLIPNGWGSNVYLNSQDSFFTQDEKQWARITIYRWV